MFAQKAHIEPCRCGGRQLLQAGFVALPCPPPAYRRARQRVYAATFTTDTAVHGSRVPPQVRQQSDLRQSLTVKTPQQRQQLPTPSATDVYLPRGLLINKQASGGAVGSACLFNGVAIVTQWMCCAASL